ncbi:MAG: hypothetical protein SNH88_07930 [Rikenellaceae bacterium]
MKTKLIAATMLLALSFTAVVAKNETPQEIAKEQLKEKATKTAKKETKSLEREGWVVTPGALPIEKQLDRSYMMQYEVDENYQPKYIMAEAMSVGGIGIGV